MVMTSCVAVFLLLFIVPGLIALVGEARSSLLALSEILEGGDLHPPSFVREIPIVGISLEARLEALFAERALMIKLLTDYREVLIDFATLAAKGAAQITFKLVMTVFSCFFFFRSGRALVEHSRLAIKLLGSHTSYELLEAIRATVRGTVYGVVLTAIAQGILAWIGFAIFGAPFPALLGFITFLLAFLPFGPPLLYVPVAVFTAVHNENWVSATFLLAWCIGIVSMADNVLRPLFISKATNLSILLVLIGVMGGIYSFGLIGLFVGPVLMAVAQALWIGWLKSSGAERVSAS